MIDYATEIKSRLKMSDVCNMYGIAVNTRGFARCCFHSEKTPSMKIYTDGYKCYGCGESGDVIGFVQSFFKVDFRGACEKINRDFGLGLPIGEHLSLREMRELEKAARERKRKQDAEKKELQQLTEAYDKAFDKYVTLCRWSKDFTPQDSQSDFNDFFVFAVKNIPIVKNALYEAETRLYEYEHRRN